jgi:SAM-dependent methyltransferase
MGMDAYGGYTRFYDLDYAGLDDDEAMLSAFATRCGSPMLELACGTGRALLPLARAGHQVVGIDWSASMLALARRKLRAAGLEDRVRLEMQDMRCFSLADRFAFVFVAVNSFMHLMTLEDQLACLVRVRQHLEPGGLLLLDLFNPDLGRLLEADGQVALDKTMVDPESGHTLLKFRTAQADLGQQVLHVTFIVDEVGAEGQVGRTVFPFKMRYLFRWELELLLRHAGFRLEALYGSYDLDPFGSESDRLIAVAGPRAGVDSRP